ncbi:hypothetical protein EV702DRAFT_500908 [Suillus placidus]|uniref:Uncharacterized protein n=1 Tax=Suillus placidus TaxID=48579 RepID=A0A9P7A3W8_9AGAM|nr:hypothetical protein EV702DRAFT_500908 [Suillus placidus]
MPSPYQPGTAGNLPRDVLLPRTISWLSFMGKNAPEVKTHLLTVLLPCSSLHQHSPRTMTASSQLEALMQQTQALTSPRELDSNAAERKRRRAQLEYDRRLIEKNREIDQRRKGTGAQPLTSSMMSYYVLWMPTWPRCVLLLLTLFYSFVGIASLTPACHETRTCQSGRKIY